MQNSPPRQRRAQRNNPQGQAARHAPYAQDAPRAQYPSYPQYSGQYPADAASGGQYGQQTAYGTQYPQYSGASPYQRPSDGGSNLPPQTAAYTVPGAGSPQKPLRPRRSREGLWLLIVIVCAALLVLGGFLVSSLHGRHYNSFRKSVEAMQRVNDAGEPVFFNGVHIDGVHIGGLTLDEARQALNQTTVAMDEQYALSVTVDGKTWRITQNELPLERNIEAVLQEAFSIGRQNSLAAMQSGLTPFQYRYQTRQDANQNGAYLYTQVTYDKATVRRLADILSSRVSAPAQDATVASFDFATHAFQFQEERSGTFLSSDEIYSAITAQMDARNYNGSIELHTSPQQPTVTRAALQANYGLIASYSTDTLAGYNRNVNIKLGCAAINGTVVESGKIFSFNETTGRRTVEKGYLLAGAIAQGRSYEETGGGVCQVSSTLFNAAAMANMKIISSSPHAWPSAYVEAGRDATVDWQNFQSLKDSLDMKFQNTSPYPIFIVAYLSDGSKSQNINMNRVLLCTVEIYGVALENSVTIQLEPVLTKETEQPTPQVEYAAADEEHPAGTIETVRVGRNGYVYETYRVFYKDGEEFKRELLRTSTYKPYAELTRIYEEK